MRRHPGTFAAGLIFMALGVAYILDALDVWQVRLGRLWPVVLIVVGAVVILGGRGPSQSAERDDGPPDPFSSADE